MIDEITFQKSEGGQTRAYLHAAQGADDKMLYDIICDLSDRGWQATPYSISGKPLLEVHGFSSEKKLIEKFKKSGALQGAYTHIPTKEDKLSFTQQVRKRSLGASGMAYLVGDVSFSMYGYKDHEPWNLAGGILYGAGTTSLLIGGRKDQSDLQTREIARRMVAHFKDIDLNLPENCSLKSITEDHKNGLIKNGDDLLRRYPSEMMNLFFAAAGACIAIAAHKSLKKPPIKLDSEEVTQVFSRLQRESKVPLSRDDTWKRMKSNHKLESILDIGLGAMTGISGLFAMSVKEKARDPDEPPKHGLEAAWQWIREKPLAVAGMGYMVSTMCHFASTMIARKWAGDERRKAVGWRLTFVLANLVAEVLLAISSKGHGEGVKSDGHVDNTVIALAADLIVKQPKAMQEYLINHMAGFLGRPDVLAMKDEEAAVLLQMQVEALRKNPWAMASQAASKQKEGTAVAQAAPEPKKIVLAPSQMAGKPLWETRIQAKDGGAPQLSTPA